MSDTETTPATQPEHHDSHVGLYMKVFGALMVLTVLTVGVSYIHFPPPFGLIVGLAIATAKAALVMAFFMHLKWEKVLIYYFLGLTAICAVILFVLPIIDAAWTGDIRVQGEHPAILDTGKAHH